MGVVELTTWAKECASLVTWHLPQANLAAFQPSDISSFATRAGPWDRVSGALLHLPVYEIVYVSTVGNVCPVSASLFKNQNSYGSRIFSVVWLYNDPVCEISSVTVSVFCQNFIFLSKGYSITQYTTCLDCLLRFLSTFFLSIRIMISFEATDWICYELFLVITILVNI